MRIETKIFGEVEIAEDRMITFKKGIVGFPEMTEFVLVHDEDSGEKAGIHWLQSIQEPGFAMPVIDPLVVCPDYNPIVEDELLEELEGVNDENLLVLSTITIPSDLTKMTANLMGPIIINAESRKACQVIVEGEHCQVKYPIYEVLKKRKEGK